MKSNRRTFVIQSVMSAGILATTRLAQAQAPAPLVQDSDPQAVALGYKSDATKADKAKYPKYAAGQQCANCALYQGKPTDAAGACPLFAGKQVGAKAWCSAWAKKA
ncbi:high-potential iron-sulfur protein [Polaromonas naphthalenivorans]|uniref:High-potential iron-sulfur protein n=1 Tax=Polaromonas naphthalenivorans (strain CJ2) TaxID=365044 RepID=A1VIW1_POLNA|nr:high-potential iron-sulfur protein [Polaromonas naphthalenivorans]ABM35589.1 High potential iron-sulfur protein [Polaromonas naphthalenivorans CJ2]